MVLVGLSHRLHDCFLRPSPCFDRQQISRLVPVLWNLVRRICCRVDLGRGSERLQASEVPIRLRCHRHTRLENLYLHHPPILVLWFAQRQEGI
jgi:hypothetical protein